MQMQSAVLADRDQFHSGESELEQSRVLPVFEVQEHCNPADHALLLPLVFFVGPASVGGANAPGDCAAGERASSLRQAAAAHTAAYCLQRFCFQLRLEAEEERFQGSRNTHGCDGCAGAEAEGAGIWSSSESDVLLRCAEDILVGEI